MKRLAFWLALAVVAASPAALAMPVQFNLVDGAGKPVHWSADNTVGYLWQAAQPPSFTTDVPEGSTLFLGLYLLRNNGGVISSPSPGVTVAGETVTVDVSLVEHSLRAGGALAWANGSLYVAEPHSNDGTSSYVYRIGKDGALADRFTTVPHPGAIAASKSELFVAGDTGIGVYSLSPVHAPLRAAPLAYAAGVTSLALLGNHLYVGDRTTAMVHILDVATLAETGKIVGEGDEALKISAGLSNIGVAATPQGTLLISDSAAIREYAAAGKWLRTLVHVKNGASLAAGANGDIALAVNSASDSDYGYTPEVWVYNADGKPRLRMVHVYMSGPKPSPDWKLGYFGGLMGSVRSPGGVALDELGHLLVSDSGDWPRDADHFFGTWKELPYDAGVVRVTADGVADARYGSRFTNPAVVSQMLRDRATRPPLQRTQAILQHGGKLSLLAWGDSITQTGGDWNGGASAKDKNWVFALQRLIHEKYPAVTVAAEANGVGGQTAAEGLSRDVTPRGGVQPDLVLLEFGTNEMGWHHYTPARYAMYMRDMITELQTLTDCDIAIVSPGPVPGTLVEAPQADYMAALRKVGTEMHVPVVDVEAAMEAKLKGVPFETYHLGPTNPHPNDAGHVVWAQAVLNTLAR